MFEEKIEIHPFQMLQIDSQNNLSWKGIDLVIFWIFEKFYQYSKILGQMKLIISLAGHARVREKHTASPFSAALTFFVINDK